MKITIITLLIIISCHNYLLAQNSELDSMLNLLKHQTGATSRVNLLNKIALKAYLLGENNVLNYATEAGNLSGKLNYPKGKAESMRMIGLHWFLKSDFNTALAHFNNALKLFTNINDTLGICRCYLHIGRTNYEQTNFKEAMNYCNKALLLSKKINAEYETADIYLNFGRLFNAQGEYARALESFQNALMLFQKLGNKGKIANCYGNISLVYNSQKDYAKSLEYDQKSLQLALETGDKMSIAMNYNNLGVSYTELGKCELALEQYQKALSIVEKLDHKKRMSFYNCNIGSNYTELGEFSKALEYLFKAQELVKSINSEAIELMIEIEFCKAYYGLKKYNLAATHGEKGYALSVKVSDNVGISDASETLAKIYAAMGNFQKAYLYHIEFKNVNDSIKNSDNTQKITALAYTYKYEKEKELAKIEQDKKDSIQFSEMKRQKNIRNTFIGGFLLVFGLLVYVFYNYKQKKKTNRILSEQKNQIGLQNKELKQLNEELNTTLEIVNQQKTEIEYAHKSITSSISYAKRIQSAVLPNQELINTLLPEHFIFFKPRDIVSGDFYFIKQIKNHLLIAAADCTGHGVPGAFMSMLGVAILNEITQKQEIISANQVVNELRKQIKHSLQQTGKSGEQQDGMDIAFCSINTETFEMSFAGAYNPCWIFRSEELRVKSEELKEPLTFHSSLFTLEADRQPVGIYIKEKPFTEHKFQLQKSDVIYLFSDGFHSQFGGSRIETMKSKRFKEILSSIYQLPMNKQKELLEHEFTTWKGAELQTDDVLVLGVKI